MEPKGYRKGAKSSQNGAKGDLQINKNNNKLKKCKRKYNKMKNRNFFECVAILSKTGGLNGCTFTVVLLKRGVKEGENIYKRKIR